MYAYIHTYIDTYLLRLLYSLTLTKPSDLVPFDPVGIIPAIEQILLCRFDFDINSFNTQRENIVILVQNQNSVLSGTRKK